MCFDWEYEGDTVRIRFDKSSERGFYGQADDGIIVFVDRFMDPGVSLGETWNCRLVYKGTDLSRYYFAWPLSKVEVCGGSIVEEPSTEETIVAVGSDVLFSNAFLPGRYEAYRSFDGSCLQLVSSRSGDIECRENTMRIDGLDRFVGKTPRNLDYSRREDGYLIKLEE